MGLHKIKMFVYKMRAKHMLLRLSGMQRSGQARALTNKRTTIKGMAMKQHATFTAT